MLPHVWQFATHPRWVMGYLADGAPRVFPNVELPGVGPMPCGDTGVLLAETNVTWKDLAWIRDAWRGPIVIKGVHTGDVARQAVDAGADAVIVSNHGGRQLDGVAASIACFRKSLLLSAIASRSSWTAASAAAPTSSRRAALARARCSIGRGYGWALGAAGGPGVARAIAILKADLVRTMRLARMCVDARAGSLIPRYHLVRGRAIGLRHREHVVSHVC